MSLRLERPPNWRLGLTQLFDEYGFDMAMYFQSNIQLTILFSGIFAVYLVFTVVFALYDQGMQNSNGFLLTLILATGRGHYYTWCFLLLISLLYFWTCKLQRMNIDYEQRISVAIEDFSLILYNIPPELKTDDIICAVNSFYGRDAIKDFLRVRQPSILRYKLKFIKLQRQYYERLQCNYKLLYQFEREKYNLKASSFWLRLTQGIGLNRDGAYYERKLQSLQKKIEAKGKAKKLEREGIIISFDSIATKCYLLSALQQKKLIVNEAVLYCKNAGGPSDMNYPNISVNNRKRIWIEILNYIVLVVIVFIAFFVTTLTRDLTEKAFNHITSVFGRFCVKCLMIGLVMQIPALFRQIIVFLVSLEGHTLYSKRDRSLVAKLFLLRFVSKMTIIYSTDFSDYVFYNAATFNKFVTIFSNSTQWRFSLAGTGTDLMIMTSLCLVFDALWMLIYHALYRWCAKKLAISQYDQILAENGAKLSLHVIFESKLVVETLCLAFGFYQPWLLLIGILYHITMAYLTRFVLVRLANKPPRISGMYILFERVQSVIICGCFVPQLQYDFTGLYAWVAFLAAAILVNVLLNTDIFNRFISKVLKQAHLYNAEKYKIQHCKMYDSYFFEERYEIMYSLSQIEIRRMHKLMDTAKHEALEVSDSLRTSVSVRGYDWAKSKFEFSDAMFDFDAKVLEQRDSSSEAVELSYDFLRIEDDL